MDNSIEKLRKDIDDIDVMILELINQRLLLANKIGKIKVQRGNELVDSSREQQLLKRLKRMNNGPLSKNALHHIFTEIITASREIQSPLSVAHLEAVRFILPGK